MLENHINPQDLVPHASNSEVGGESRDRKGVFKDGGRCLHEEQKKELFPHKGGEEMGGLEYELKKQYQLENPIKLDPKTATFEQVAAHARRWQRLSDSTIKHRLRSARRMSKHPVYPIDFNNPSYEQFIAYMNYREDVEGASGYALKNDLNTMIMFLRAYHIDPRKWFYKLPIMPINKKRILPFPETVNKFFHHKYSNDRYENALYQYLHFHNFFIGWRVPSEPCAMTINDVNIDEEGRGSLTITETKKHRTKRTILPGKFILSSPTYKSFKNWIDKWRPKVENQYSGDALYLQPSGKPFTVRFLGRKLSETGKQVWKPFQPYDSRHWCAVALLIKTKIETGRWDERRVQRYLGHERVDTTMSYIRYAEEYYYQYPVDWFAHALKSHKNGRVKHEHLQCKCCTKTSRFSGLLNKFSPYDEYGLVGI
ncbi:MAG TPA: site-specific integrase [Thermoplasmatales archaeon]|nr:site-specific integrase [Thermoplasmatales archaeon]